MNSYPAALSGGRPGQTCILMQSALGQECVPSAVHCVWKCLSILNARMGCTAGSAGSMQSKALHNLCQRMRARKDTKESHSDPECGNSTSLRSKTSAYSCSGSSLGQPKLLQLRAVCKGAPKISLISVCETSTDPIVDKTPDWLSAFCRLADNQQCRSCKLPECSCLPGWGRR